MPPADGWPDTPDALIPLHRTKVWADEESIARENVLAKMTYLACPKKASQRFILIGPPALA